MGQTNRGLDIIGAEMTAKEDNPRLKTKIMIDIVHGFGVNMYLLPLDVANGPDESIECLQRTLKKEEIRRGGKLPPTLFLQFDNCFRENKNTYMLAYLAWLVERGVFNRIYLHFHPVGHTHNECDQCASRVSRACHYANIGCRCQLINVLQKCYHPQPHVESIENVADFKHLFNPDVEDEGAWYPPSCLITQMKNIRHVHAFMFHRNQQGRVVRREKLDVDVLDWSEADLVFKKVVRVRPKVATFAVCMSHEYLTGYGATTNNSTWTERSCQHRQHDESYYMEQI